MYDILGDKYLSKSAASILVVCNKQGKFNKEKCLHLIMINTYHPNYLLNWTNRYSEDLIKVETCKGSV